MIPSSSPSATSSETSTTIFAPPMSSPRLRMAMIGELTPWLLERRDRRLDVAWRDGLDDLDGEVALAVVHELHLEHRLEHRVIGRADVLLALRREELPTFERADHRVHVRRVALGDRAADHLRRHEAVRREDVRHLVLLRHVLDEPGVHRVVRR